MGLASAHNTFVKCCNDLSAQAFFTDKRIPLTLNLMNAVYVASRGFKMNEDTLNIEIRKYLKNVGITSQREIEHAVLKAVEAGKLNGSETITVKMTLDVPAVGVSHSIEGTIALE
jgi:hypothetical protein